MAVLMPPGRQQYFDSAGDPLVGGKLYTYNAGTNTPRPTYTTEGQLFTNPNPLILDGRGEAVAFWSGAYKITLTDAFDVVIWTIDNVTSVDVEAAADALEARLADTTSPSNGANMVGLQDAGGYFPNLTGATKRVENALATVMARAYGANVVLYGADNTGVADSSAAFALAAATGKTVFVPDGTFSVNWTITQHLICVGDAQSILSPRNTAIAAVVFRAPAPNWTYQSLFQNIRFLGTARVGIGFTFGQTVPANYVAGDEVMNNVTFRNCYFRGLDKGVQFPFGNIGTEFYSCGFTDNKYGAYTINNKFGTAMHAGNKYFYGGQIDNCDVGVYCHDTTGHMYGLYFSGTIFEINKVNVYAYQATGGLTQPFMFSGVGNEQSGANLGGSTSIDQWTGTVLTTTSFTNRCWIFDGLGGQYQFDRCGIMGDIDLRASGAFVKVDDSVVEMLAVNSGGPCSVTGTSSEINFSGSTAQQGFPAGAKVLHKNLRPQILSDPAFGQTRWVQAPQRCMKSTSYGGTGQSLTMNAGATTTGLVIVPTNAADATGTLYPNVNEYVVPNTTSGSFAFFPTINVTPSAIGSWIVATMAVKWISGTAPRFFVGDLGTAQYGTNMTIPETGVWYTLACIGQAPTTAGVRVQLAGEVATGTCRVSAMQVRNFPTRQEAQAFLDSGVFVE